MSSTAIDQATTDQATTDQVFAEVVADHTFGPFDITAADKPYLRSVFNDAFPHLAELLSQGSGRS